MGDIIHALPAVAALRAAHPAATIGWVVEERWLDLLSMRDAVLQSRSEWKPLVDVIHTVDTHSWRKALLSGRTWRESAGAMKSIRRAKYDTAIDFQGAWKSGFIGQFSAAPHRIGFRHPRERGATLFYTKTVAAGRPHVIEQNLELAATLGAVDSLGKEQQLLPIDPAANVWAEQILADRGLDRFAIINPGAGWGAKCWPADNYAAVARTLGTFGLRSVINYGPSEEFLAHKVANASEGAAVAIPCSISELIAVTRRAGLFVGGDTGPMHLAAALKIPVVGIFGPTDPARNGPYGTASIILRRSESVTNHSRRLAADKAMLTITADEVVTAARELLNRCASSREVPHA